MDSPAMIFDLGDDLGTEILLRLPPESIFRYRSLSEKWNSLLASPEFLSHYSRRFHHRRRRQSPHHNLLGFFLHQDFTLGAPRTPFLSIQPRIGREYFSSDLGSFVTSSNGLVLCKSHQRSYHILNPVTRKHVSLPPPAKNYHMLSIGLSCDEDGDDLTPRYQVVIADMPVKWHTDNQLFIETYSSETKEWRESVLVGTSDFGLPTAYPPAVVNGVFYWWVKFDCLGAYDPHNKQGGSRDRNHLQLIQLPQRIQVPGDPVFDHHNKHCLIQTPDGRLIFGRISAGVIKIWELSGGELGFWRETTIPEQEWVLIYEVPCEMGLELVALLAWNPLILMVRQGRRMFEYDMETKLMKHIVVLPEKPSLDQPFFEAVSFSSYLLA